MVVTENRRLSGLDYLNQLQLEYVITKFRLNIYENTKDLYYYNNLLKNKVKKIDRLSSKYNVTETVLNSRLVFSSFLKSFLGSFGYPNFIYRENEENSIFARLDFKKYYLKDTNVSYIDTEGMQKQGIVVFANFDKREVSIKVSPNSKQSIVVGFKNVCREIVCNF